MKAQVPRWQLEGYKKKKTCDRCSFVAKSGAQIIVYHVDGNLNNCDLLNLKTVCLNCTIEIAKLNLPWGRGGVLPDL